MWFESSSEKNESSPTYTAQNNVYTSLTVKYYIWLEKMKYKITEIKTCILFKAA